MRRILKTLLKISKIFSLEFNKSRREFKLLEVSLQILRETAEDSHYKNPRRAWLNLKEL